MLFLLRGIHISFWLFVFWVALRVWELNFEVSPLPAWTLPLFVFLVLLAISTLLSRRLQKRHPLDRKNVLKATALLILGTFFWELGLTLYLSGWSRLGDLFTWRFVVGLLVQALASFLAALWLRRTRPPFPPPEPIPPVNLATPSQPLP